MPRRFAQSSFAGIARQIANRSLFILLIFAAPACDSTDPMNMDSNDNTAGLNLPGIWSRPFDVTDVGALSSVWGSGPNDVFIVGGQPDQAEIYHFDGLTWRAMHVPQIPVLVWVFGFKPDDVFAVGLGGSVVHYDGKNWTKLDTGTTASLWGVWGESADDLWIVGEDGVDLPVILHYDGAAFTSIPPPVNDRDASALFKVFGAGGHDFAVGDNGLIVEFKNGAWSQIASGANADDDFVSLWGLGASPIVAVGGRSTARIGIFDGEAWTTLKPEGIPGLNAVFMDASNVALCGGIRGFIGRFDPATREIVQEPVDETLDIHAIWGDGEGRFYAVGGRFSAQYTGLALVRTVEAPAGEPVPPLPPEGAECAKRADCDDDDPCTTDQCNAGACEHDSIADCEGSQCFKQVCTNGNCEDVPTDCDDGDDCTIDACFDGACMNLPKDCYDDDPCTDDTCVNGVCINTPLCGPNEICVNGICEPAPDCVVNADCNDNVPCTIDTCESGACVFTPMVCDDSSVCTTDACVAGACVFTPIVDCACDSEADCPVGKNCIDSVCTAEAGPDLEVGIGESPFQACNSGNFRRLHDGDELPLCQGFQADFLGDAFITLRTMGIRANAHPFISTQLTLDDSPCSGSISCDPASYTCVNGFCSPALNSTIPAPTPTQPALDVLQFLDIDILVLAENDVSDFDGRPATLNVTIFEGDHPENTASLEIPVTLFGRKLCPTGVCPMGQTCESGIDYCDHP